MAIKVKKLMEDAVLPSKAHADDAGWDLTAVRMELDPKRDIVTYGTGLAIEVPKGCVGLLFPRSSVYKHQLALANCVGVLDHGYQGEVTFKFRVVRPHISRYGIGDRIGQLVVVRLEDAEVEEVDALDPSERGEGGYGSSGG